MPAASASMSLRPSAIWRDCRSRLDACAARIDAGDVSWHSATHELVSLVLFLALVAAPLVLARAFSGDEPWRDLHAYSITTGWWG